MMTPTKGTFIYAGQKPNKAMNAILAFADPAVATSGAIVIVILSLMALIRSKMPS